VCAVLDRDEGESGIVYCIRRIVYLKRRRILFPGILAVNHQLYTVTRKNIHRKI